MAKSLVEVGVSIDGTWVDATQTGDGVLVRDPIKIKLGRSNWSSRTDSGKASASFADRDGRWSPDYTSGAYYGDFRRNIPFRVGRRFGTPYLRYIGPAADVASTPNVGGGGGGSPSTPSVTSITESAETSFTTSHGIDMPATVAAGERLVLVASGGHNSYAPTSEFDDWTQILARDLHLYHRWVIYTLLVPDAATATALSGATLQFSTSTSVKSSAQVWRIAGARAGGEGTGWSAGTPTSGFGTDPNGPSVTAAWGATTNLFVSVFTSGGTGANVSANPSGYTAGADGNASSGVVVGSAYKASSSATDDPGAFTIDDSENWEAQTLVFQPTEVSGSAGSLDVTGDLETRIEFQLHEDLVDIFADTPGARVRLAHRSGGANGWEWELLNYGGEVHTSFVWYDSSGLAHRYETVGIERLPFSVLYDRVALRVTLDVDDGASDSRARFYYADDGIDGTWTELGDGDTGEGTTSIKVTSAPLRIGGNPFDIGHVPITGKVFAFRIYDGIGGTVVANPDFTIQTVGASSFDDSTGATWTVGADGMISDTRWRFHGELSSIPTRWNTSGSDVWAPVEAAGLFRRLRQGARRLESAIRRGVLRRASDVVQYWPCEEQGGGYITRFGAAVGTAPIVATNAVPDTGQNQAFLASEALATFGDSIWTADVDTYTATDAWQVRWLMSIPDDFADNGVAWGNVILQVWTTDVVWEVAYRNDSGGEIQLYGIGGGSVVYSSGWFGFDATGSNWRWHLSVQQNGADVDITLVAADPATGLEDGGIADTLSAAVAGQVYRLVFNRDSDNDDVSIGHVTLQKAVTSLSSLDVELTAYNGEPAGERIIRLCLEEGLAYRIQGDPTDTEQMGPQTAKPLMDLLEECADTDLGLLFEPRETIAVGYRTFVDMNNQEAKVGLDYAAGEVAGSPELDRDDATFSNDVTVTNASGTTARAVLDDGSAMSVSEPPIGAGRYDSTFEVNGQENRLQVLADRRLKLSSPDEPRISKLRLGLHYPAVAADSALADSILDARLGDLLTIQNNLPVALGTTTIRQIIQSTTDTIGSHEHYIDCLTTPGSPWLTVAQAITDLDATGGVGANLLTWTPPFNDGAAITSYDVQRSTAGESTGFADLETINPAATYIDTSTSVGVQYWYRVRATNSAGDAPWSNVVTATPTEATDPPEAIADLTATASGTSIDLAWSAPTSTETITSYDIQRSETSDTGPWTDVEIDLAPTTSYSDTGLSGSTQYWYRVRATSSEGDGPWSNIDSDTTGPSGISIVGTGSHVDDTSSSTTHSITLPTGIQADDLICIWANTQSSTSDGAPTATGYTQRYSQGAASSFRPLITLLYKKATDTSDSGASVTLTWGVSCDANMVAVVFRGVDTTTPFDATEPSSTSGGSNPDPASITTATDGAWVLAVVDGNRTPTSTPTISTGYATAVTQVPADKSCIVTYKEVTTAGAENPGAWTWTPIDNHTATTTALRPASGGGGGTGGTGTAAPTIPSFSSDVTITAGQNVKTLIEAQPEGTHFTLAAGTHTNCENVKLKTNMHVRLATGCILEGSGKGYCFRPATAAVTGVTIGGDPAGTRPIIRNYGNGTTSQDFGAIMGRTDEPLNLYPTEPAFIYTDVDDWFIYHIDLQENSSNAIKQGSNWTIFDCEIHGHTVTGIQGDRIVGGLVHSCLLYWNALFPATGAASNGAQIKYTWINADIGRTAITPTDRTKAQLVVSNSTFEAVDRDGGPGAARIGIWFDLDCQNCLVEYSSFDDHTATSMFAEGCNNIEFSNFTVRNSDGYGNAFNENFVNGALCAGESTNIYFHDGTLIGCDRAMVNRMSNRSSDWFNSDDGSFVNYAWATGPRYWLLATGRGTTPSASAQSNIWTGGNTWENITLIDCGRVMINEGTDAGGMLAQGATPNDLTFTGNDYSGSPSIQFYNKSNTALANLAAWQALGYDT